MDSYSVDFSRTLWASYIMIIAILLAIILNQILSVLVSSVGLTVESSTSLLTAFSVNTVTAPFVFSILYTIFDRWGWRVRIINRIIPIPNLRGTWEGELYSSHDGGTSEVGTLTIDQSWTQIEIVLEIDGAYSESKTASLQTNKAYPELVFTYESYPIGFGSDKRDTHQGTNRLTLRNNAEGELILVGDYYTSQQRNTHGEMEFRLANRETSILSTKDDS